MEKFKKETQDQPVQPDLKVLLAQQAQLALMVQQELLDQLVLMD
jgi:hypothetical protein